MNAPQSEDLETCERCRGTKLVTVQYEWRGAVCDADDQPCPECVPITNRGEVMNPPVPAAGSTEARNLNTPHRHGTGAVPQGSEAQATQHSAAPCQHQGFYYCKKCGLDLTPDIAPFTGTYGDGPNCARSLT